MATKVFVNGQSIGNINDIFDDLTGKNRSDKTSNTKYDLKSFRNFMESQGIRGTQLDRMVEDYKRFNNKEDIDKEALKNFNCTIANSDINKIAEAASTINPYIFNYVSHIDLDKNPLSQTTMVLYDKLSSEAKTTVATAMDNTIFHTTGVQVHYDLKHARFVKYHKNI